MKLNEYVTLGRSGLRVSPLCLGTMTFGTEWGWGSEEEAARAIFNRYFERGGNFVDTADMYTNGKSEELVGKFIKDAKVRDQVVLATKLHSTPSREIRMPAGTAAKTCTAPSRVRCAACKPNTSISTGCMHGT
jgi:aryl-alcohol dehydrogenase-like predicted oxidoreductase